MEIKKIKAEVEFHDIECFEPFEHNGSIFLKLPALSCRVSEYYRHGLLRDVKGDFNAIGLSGPAIEDYKYFEADTLVRPLKAELKIYE